MNVWTFHNREMLPAEQWKRKGKPEWSDMISIRLNRNDALQLIVELANRAQNYRSEEFEVVLVGRLEKADDD